MAFRARRVIAAAVATLVVLGATILGAGTARAHTDFESSTPSAGSTVDAPVELVTIVFSGVATPVGEMFVALTPDGVVQTPTSVETLDDEIFSLRFDPPLAGGQVGVRWTVQAADSHPIEGAFAFLVDAPAPTTTVATTPVTTTAPATVASTVAPVTTVAATTAPPSTGAAAPPTSDVDVAAAPVVASEDDPAPPAGVAPAVALDDFLTVDNSRPGQTISTVGRLIGLLGVVLGLGALAFVAGSLRGRRSEVSGVVRAVRMLGVVIVVGAVVEYVGVARVIDETLASNWSTSAGFATVLRLAGGLALAVGIGGTIARTGPPAPAGHSLSAAVVDEVSVAPSAERPGEPIMRWRPNARSWPAAGGVVVILVSFWFDGHTVSKGFRPLHALVNTVHVAAGAVWVGGVVAMAAVIWSRSRSDRPTGIAELVVRFSKVATIALASVVAAGGVMAFLVLDSFAELTGTEWGQILLLKTAAVGLAMIGGAYNHFKLLPALEAAPESTDVIVRIRSTVTAEAIVLLFVVVVTAWLVTAAS